MPEGLTAVAANGQVQLNWNSFSAALSYQVKRSTNSGGPYAVIASLSTNSFDDATAANGTTYYYVVSMVTPLGESANSPAVSATPSAPAAVAWFKAGAIAGLANGSAVSTWPDLSGNGYDATQSIVSQRPTYALEALNGLPAVRFNAANSSALAFNRPVQDDFTIFCVFGSTQGQGSGTLYYQGAGLVNGDVPGVTTDFGSCLFANGQIGAGTGQPDVAVDSTAGFNDGKPHLMTFKRTEGTGEVDLYMDGAFMGGTTGSTLSLMAPSQLDLGAVLSGGGFFSGDIAEVKIFNTALADLDRQAEESGFESQYAIAGGSPMLSVVNGSAKGLTLGWPGWAADWRLVYATNLTPPTVWLTATNVIGTSNGQFNVTIPINSGTRFFRLASP
jgi:hypothetical protein